MQAVERWVKVIAERGVTGWPAECLLRWSDLGE